MSKGLRIVGKALLFSILGIIFGAAAEAARMSTLETLAPESMLAWQKLSDQDKTDTINDFIAPVLKYDTKLKDSVPALVDKMRKCTDKEITDPDYKTASVSIPVMVPLQVCMMKYNSIIQMEKQKRPKS